MTCYNIIFVLFIGLTLSHVLEAQSLAYAALAPEYVGPRMNESRVSENETNKLNLSEKANYVYLTSLLENEIMAKVSTVVPEDFAYVEDHLNQLRMNYGDHPYFMDCYLHPQIQHLTGFHMGRAGMPILEKIEFTDGRVMANLVCRTEGAQIFYTTDGSIPTERSERFEQPIELTTDLTINAKSIRTDLEHSPIISFNKNLTIKKSSEEKLDENKIMGIYPMSNSDQVLIKYKTNSEVNISISMVDKNRDMHHAAVVFAPAPQMGYYFIDTSQLDHGSYLIKFKFENGKTTYRQMMK